MSHTPGPRSELCQRLTEPERLTWSVSTGQFKTQQEAADWKRLIAAAPDLLRVVKEFVAGTHVLLGEDHHDWLVEQGRAAIHKAEGD